MNWIPEKEAARRFGYTPEYFRRIVKKRQLEINYTAPRGRNFKYLEQDMEKVLRQFSTLTK